MLDDIAKLRTKIRKSKTQNLTVCVIKMSYPGTNAGQR